MAVVAVAVSGGCDSTALLHCTLRIAKAHDIQVVALHVNHGLMPQADAWQRQVQLQARRWGAGFRVTRLHGAPSAGESVEAWARRERYAALAALAHDAGAALVLLAHHRRDQAETWLLQALRGGGPAGLASMPPVAQRQGIVWARPWLDMPRQAIESYVFQHRLRTVQDASNADPRFARSRLRLAVWPALQAAFEGAESALAASAARAHDANVLMAEVAAADLQALQQGQALRLAPWLALSAARRLNALRAWLAAVAGRGAPEALLQRLHSELPVSRAGRWPVLSGVELRLYRGLLSLHRLPVPAALLQVIDADATRADFSLPGHHALPAWGGALCVTAVSAGGIAVQTLQDASLRWRTGGERFQQTPGGLPRSLKKQFQAAALPAWERTAPLLFAADGRLLFVPGLGVDARCMAAPGCPQRALQWQAEPQLTTGARQFAA